MYDRFSLALRAFESLARTVAASPGDAAAISDRLCADVRADFGLARTSVVGADELAARHPLVEEARRLGRAATDGQRVAVPLRVDGSCHGYLLGDAAGRTLELDEQALGLLTALGVVAAVSIEQAQRHERLQASLDARTTFVSLASHELRTPIAVVHGVVSTLHLRGDALTPEQLQELRATAFEQTTRLALLTEQLLDLSRLESRGPLVVPQRFRPRRLVDELLMRIAPDRRDDVLVEIDPELDLVTDPDVVERVVSNLVVNALRYGGPPVRVRLDRGPPARLLVEDEGAGIDPALVPRLFERFSRGSRDRQGAGLGLAIARSYAQALGGSLVYEQGDPHGARFALTLPEPARAPAGL